MNSFPKKFLLLIAFLLALLLAGYLWLSDVVPKQSPKPIREDIPSTAENSALPEEDVSSWKEYRDPKLGFSIRIPNNWKALAESGKNYSVNFTDVASSYELSVKAFENSKLDTVLAQLRKQAQRGLFPPADTTPIELTSDGSANSLARYTSPQGDKTISTAAIENNGTIFVIEYKQPIGSKDLSELFSLWVRSFSI
ncbi:MAG: hypothetical protein WCJ29_04890 [bacterium]